MFIPDLFSEEEYIELGHVSNMPKEHKCICSRSKAFIPEATSQIEGLSTIMSREWTEEAKSCDSIVQIYRNPRLLFCAIGTPFFMRSLQSEGRGERDVQNSGRSHLTQATPDLVS